ncbi:MAG TPA: glycosyltransferase family 39 protein [Candidatus Binatia bacterium]
MRATIHESNITRAIWLIALAGGLALRLYMVAQPPIITPDSTDRYEPQARQILAGRSIVRFAASTGAIRVNQPGYPYFLAAVYSVAGESRRAVVIAQALLEALTVIIFLILARRADLAPLSRAVVAAIVLLCPVLPLLARAIWSETLATAALALTVLAALAAVRNGRATAWILAGAGLALCWLIRPDFLPTIISLSAAMLMICGRALPFGRAALAAVAFAATLTPWLAQNYIQLGKIAPLNAYGDILEHPYVRWLDTWVDDVSQLAPYWWYPRDPASPSTFPSDKVIDPEERALAEAALAQARATESLKIEPVNKTFDALGAKARRERPFRTFVVVPLRRVASTWLNLAGYAKSSAVRTAWILLLLAALAGACWGLRHRFDITLLLLAIVIGRSAPPAAFAIAVEPRLVVEALPAVFIFAGFLFEAGRRRLSAAAAGAA